jgi:cyclin-dependent kinase 7
VVALDLNRLAPHPPHFIVNETITMENYKVMKALGSGMWGVVHMEEQKVMGQIVAVKKIKSEKPEEGVNFTAVREIKLLRDFKHKNIIELVDCSTTHDMAICLVYKWSN